MTRPERRLRLSGFDTQGHVNAAVYGPGEPCDAHQGCPTFSSLYAVVYWFPGRRTEIDVYLTEAEAEEAARKRLQR